MAARAIEIKAICQKNKLLFPDIFPHLPIGKSIENMMRAVVRTIFRWPPQLSTSSHQNAGELQARKFFPDNPTFLKSENQEIREIREFFVPNFQNQEILPFCFSKTRISFRNYQKINGNVRDDGENPGNAGDALYVSKSS